MGKCSAIFPYEDLTFNLPELVCGDNMFYSGRSGGIPNKTISFTDGSLSKMTSAANFAGTSRLRFNLSNLDLTNCRYFSLGNSRIQTDNYLKLGANGLNLTQCEFVNNEVKLHFLYKFSTSGYGGEVTFEANHEIHKVHLIFSNPYKLYRSFFNCDQLTDVEIQGELYVNESSLYNSNFYNCQKLKNVSLTKIWNTMY